MIQRIYTIRDVISKVCSPPVAMVNDGMFWRIFGRLVVEIQAPVKDLEVYFLGTFDNETMEIEAQKEPMQLVIPYDPAHDAVEEREELERRRVAI